ncbi:hypothetical protein [Nonomuraea basaltis]|uniref:hypothetical protein n=1 Tax=Nonomuraea basaltis TaxID=2495887 RepID=UPI00110C6A7B|nr:hypothetical protein [Nonomuraea basaltis]TMR88657.1 hypothetical protein EJK15_65005 [Nonomuraea basaltis]
MRRNTASGQLDPGVLPVEREGRIDLVGVIGRAVLAELLPPRRPRISVRKVKSPSPATTLVPITMNVH